MKLQDILKYIEKHTLLIVGNREDVQIEALKRGTAILITEAFTHRNLSSIMRMSMNYPLFHQVMIHF